MKYKTMNLVELIYEKSHFFNRWDLAWFWLEQMLNRQLLCTWNSSFL